MRDVTLVFLVDGDRILLGMKKVGFGQGKWNGAGGKVEDGESILASACRELEEELSVRVVPENLKEVAILDFYFPHKPAWNQRGHIYFCSQWEGEPKESRELLPKWFSVEDIPYDEMWSDDIYWLPLVLEGTYVRADFSFDEDGGVLQMDFKEPK